MKKRIFSFLMCLCVSVSVLTAVTPTARAAGFHDVPSDAYYAAAVDWAVSNGITNGTSATTFSPNQTCTKAEIITFLWRAAGKPASKFYSGDFNPFFDIDESAYYYQAAKWSLGTLDYDSNFKPNTPCTRASTAEYLWRGAGSKEVNRVAFSDVEADSTLEKAVSWAIHHGVTNGTSSTTFSPADTVTRGQIVTFLYRQYVAPIDNSALTNKTPDPIKYDTYDGQLDPPCPEDFRDGPQWYGSLTPPSKMSNARLIAELKSIRERIDYFNANDIGYAESPLVREMDLQDEVGNRWQKIDAYYNYYLKGYWTDESIRTAYEELISKYGPDDAIRQWYTNP